ncbi:MAG: hypothetical protein ACE5HB_03360 [Terriglobia bacterium]
MLSARILELDREIRKLKPVAERVHRLAQGLPAAERNAYMILRHLEMLEIEVCDVVTALEAGRDTGEET